METTMLIMNLVSVALNIGILFFNVKNYNLNKENLRRLEEQEKQMKKGY